MTVKFLHDGIESFKFEKKFLNLETNPTKCNNAKNTISVIDLSWK